MVEEMYEIGSEKVRTHNANKNIHDFLSIIAFDFLLLLLFTFLYIIHRDIECKRDFGKYKVTIFAETSYYKNDLIDLI
jgi:hypothetical protein